MADAPSVSSGSRDGKTLPPLSPSGPYVAISATPPQRGILRNGRVLAGLAGGLTVVLLTVAVALLSKGGPDVERAAGGSTVVSTFEHTLSPATTSPAQPAMGSAGSGIPEFREHQGLLYAVDVPVDWDPTFLDRAMVLGGGSSASRWEIPFESLLQIQTSAPLTGTIAQDCGTIFDDRQRARVDLQPEMTIVGDHDVCQFSYIRQDGQYRMEYLLAIGDREFSIAAGGSNRVLVRGVALQAVSTLQLR